MHEPELAKQVALASRGDADALQCLIVAHHASLRRVVAGAIDAPLRTYIDPDDVLQEAYVSVFQQCGKIEFATSGHLYNWLKRFALDRMKDAQRACRRQKRDVARRVPQSPNTATSYPDLLQRISAADTSPSRQIGKEEAVAVMLSCLARLTEDQRAVIRLRFLDDVSVSEVAERLGVLKEGSAQAFEAVLTANGPASLAAVPLDSVQLGNSRVNGLKGLVNPHLETGLLGGEFLNHFIYSVDPASGTLTLKVAQR